MFVRSAKRVNWCLLNELRNEHPFLSQVPYLVLWCPSQVEAICVGCYCYLEDLSLMVSVTGSGSNNYYTLKS